MKYINYMKRDMEKVLKQMVPFFESYGELFIYNNDIRFKCNDGVTETVVNFSSTVDNDWVSVYEYLPFNADSIFEEVGTELTELKVKSFPKFDIEEWKKYIVKKFNFQLREDGDITCGDWVVISSDNDTSFNGWHESFFEYNHNKFTLTAKEYPVYLKSEEDCIEFERILDIINDFFKNIPDLNKKEN